METFYIITQIEADLIGRFNIDNHTGFDPYCGKQVNGDYVVTVDEVNRYIDRVEIQAVDFASKITKTSAQLDFYIPPDPSE